MERRSLLGLLGFTLLASRPAAAADDAAAKGVRWVTERCINGNVTARELRWAWCLQKKGVDYVKDDAMRASYENRAVATAHALKDPNVQHVDDECDVKNKKHHHPDYAKIPSLRRLSSEFKAKDLYGNGPWDPNVHALLPGDILVLAMPWSNYGNIIVIQSWDKAMGRGAMLLWDEENEKRDANTDFPLVLRNRDYGPKDQDPDDANPNKKRYVRPGFIWLRLP